MTFKQVYVCDVCGKEKLAPSWGSEDKGPKEWYTVRHLLSTKMVCTLTCLRNFPSPVRKARSKKGPAKRG